MQTITFEKHGANITTTEQYRPVVRKINFRLPVITQKTRKFYLAKTHSAIKPLLKEAGAKFTNSELGPLILLKRTPSEFQNELEIRARVGELVHAPIAHITLANGETRAAYSLLKNYISMNDYIKNVATKAQRIKLATRLGKTVRELHDNFIVHGDLHPENIMLSIDDDGNVEQVKLIDLPQSKIVVAQFKRERKTDFKILQDKLKFLKITPSKEELEAFTHAYLPKLETRRQRRK